LQWFAAHLEKQNHALRPILPRACGGDVVSDAFTRLPQA